MSTVIFSLTFPGGDQGCLETLVVLLLPPVTRKREPSTVSKHELGGIVII